MATNRIDVATKNAVMQTKAIINGLHGAETLRASAMARAIYAVITACDVARIRQYVETFVDPYSGDEAKDARTEARDVILCDVFRVAQRVIGSNGKTKLEPSELFGVVAARKEALTVMRTVLANSAVRTIIWRTLDVASTARRKSSEYLRFDEAAGTVSIAGAICQAVSGTITEKEVLEYYYRVGRGDNVSISLNIAAQNAGSFIKKDAAQRATGGTQAKNKSVTLTDALTATSELLVSQKGKELSRELTEIARETFITLCQQFGIIGVSDSKLFLPEAGALHALMADELRLYNKSCAAEEEATKTVDNKKTVDNNSNKKTA